MRHESVNSRAQTTVCLGSAAAMTLTMIYGPRSRVTAMQTQKDRADICAASHFKSGNVRGLFKGLIRRARTLLLI